MKDDLNLSGGQHFEEDEIDSLAWAIREETTELDAVDLRHLRQHLDQCPLCREKVDERVAQIGELHASLAEGRGEPGPDCPRAEIWPLAAAGLLPEADFAEHAASCFYCGSQLRQAQIDINGEPTAEEEAAVANLPSSGPGTLRVMAAERLSKARNPARTTITPQKVTHWPVKPKSSWWLLAAATLIFLSLSTALWQYEQHWAGDPERLVAAAYSNHRTVEWRFRGAQAAPLRVTRGGESANPNELVTPDFLRLEAKVSEEVAAHPDDPYWISAKGRINLLAWKYDTALTAFKRAAELKPESADALTDLAGAYFERAEGTGHDVDYGTAIDLLSQALQKNPGDPVALFNRGLANERMYLFGQAVADWEELLKVEPSGAWADEVRRRLAEVKKKLDDHRIPG